MVERKDAASRVLIETAAGGSSGLPDRGEDLFDLLPDLIILYDLETAYGSLQP